MEIIKQSFLAAKVKEELRELKRGQQHRANLQTQASVHDSSKIIEATPMSSPISFGEDVETSSPPLALKHHNQKCRRRNATGATSRSTAFRPGRSD